jgi:hypothetical protein
LLALKLLDEVFIQVEDLGFGPRGEELIIVLDKKSISEAFSN